MRKARNLIKLIRHKLCVIYQTRKIRIASLHWMMACNVLNLLVVCGSDIWEKVYVKFKLFTLILTKENYQKHFDKHYTLKMSAQLIVVVKIIARFKFQWLFWTLSFTLIICMSNRCEHDRWNARRCQRTELRPYIRQWWWRKFYF